MLVKDNKNQNHQKRIFSKKWNKIFNFYGKNEHEETINHLKFLDDKKVFTDEMVILFRNVDTKVLYINSIVEKILGYTPEEYTEKDIFFNRGNPNKQKSYYPNALSWVSDFQQRNKCLEATNLNCCHGGIIQKHKDGSDRKFIVKYKLEKIKDNILPEIDLCIFYEASQLFKEDDYWLYFEKMIDNKKCTRLYSNTGDHNHFISDREKEILLLVGNGMSSKEIASKLNISLETVSQHRKNMIKRINAKDTSSLIQICKTCEII